MRINPDRLLPAACVAGSVFWMSALALRFPPGDGDLLWQRWLGERILHEHAIPRTLGPETFAASGAPWTPHEWLFALALTVTTDRGAPWVVPLACALAAGIALTMIVLRSHGTSDVLSAAAVLVCALSMIQSFGARAQVFGWAGLASVLWLLETDGPAAWGAVPVTIVWANLHASVFLAPLLAAMFAAMNGLRDRRWSPAVVRSCSIASGCALATLATPLGFDLVRYAVTLIGSPIRHSISEWGATSIDSTAFVLGALPLVLLLVAFGIRASLRDRVIACVFLVMLFAAVRNVPIFAIAVAPVAFAAIPRRRPSPALGLGLAPIASWTTIVIVVAASLAITTDVWRQAPAAAQTLPYGLARTLLHEARTPPRVFCEDFAWCSIFLVERLPATFFMDGRCDPYPLAVWHDYREVLDGNRGWSAILDARRIDAVLVRRDGALDSLLAQSHAGWRTIAADRGARLYVRPALSPKKKTDLATLEAQR